MNLTYRELESKLIEKFKSLDEWKNDILEVGVYAQIIKLFAYLGELIGYKIDAMFIETTENAQLYSSKVNQSRFLGYTPKRKIGSSGILVVGTDPTFSMPELKYGGALTFIPKNSIIGSDENEDVICYTLEDAQLNQNTMQRVKKANKNQIVVQVSETIVGIPCDNHGFIPNQKIYITRSRKYNGLYLVHPSSTTNQINILSNYTLETMTGTETIYSGYLFIPIKSGTRQEFDYTCVGLVNEEILIFTENCDEYGIEVYYYDFSLSSYVLLQKVDDLYFVNDINNFYYTLENMPSYNGFVITLGDGLTTRKTSNGDLFKIVYYDTTGSESNINGIGVVNTFINSIVDIEGNPVDIYCTNLDSISGGKDLESTDDIIRNSRVSRNSGNQLNNRSSWINFVKAYNFVNKSMVWTEQDLGTHNTSGMASQNVHYITGITTEGTVLTNNQEMQIYDDILIYKDPSDIVEFKKCKINKLKLYIKAVLKKNISLKFAKDAISEALKESYSVDKMDFLQEINNSNYVSVIESVKSVVIRNYTQAYYAEENIDFSSSLLPIAHSLIDPLNPLKEIKLVGTSFQIWIKRKINYIWEEPVMIAHSLNGTDIIGVNTFNVYGVISGNYRLYQVFDILSDVIPSISKNGTTTDNSILITVDNVNDLKEGMYVSGLNIDSNTLLLEIINSTTIKLDKPTLDTGSGTGQINFCVWEDIGESFGVVNPIGVDSKGYILYLVYQTMNGLSERIGDIRLANFDAITLYDETLTEWDLSYE